MTWEGGEPSQQRLEEEWPACFEWQMFGCLLSEWIPQSKCCNFTWTMACVPFRSHFHCSPSWGQHCDQRNHSHSAMRSDSWSQNFNQVGGATSYLYGLSELNFISYMNSIRWEVSGPQILPPDPWLLHYKVVHCIINHINPIFHFSLMYYLQWAMFHFMTSIQPSMILLSRLIHYQ